MVRGWRALSYVANLERYLALLKQDPKCPERAKSFVTQQLAEARTPAWALKNASLLMNLTKNGSIEPGGMVECRDPSSSKCGSINWRRSSAKPPVTT
jgi:hypothetical protein